MTTPSTNSGRTFCPKEYKVVALRECPVPEEMHLCDTPDSLMHTNKSLAHLRAISTRDGGFVQFLSATPRRGHNWDSNTNPPLEDQGFTAQI